MKIKLGDKVKDKLTPFKGTVVGMSQWISGCDRVTVQGNKLENGVPTEPQSFDIDQVELIKPKKKPVKKKTTGGPMKLTAKSMRGF